MRARVWAGVRRALFTPPPLTVARTWYLPVVCVSKKGDRARASRLKLKLRFLENCPSVATDRLKKIQAQPFNHRQTATLLYYRPSYARWPSV